MLIPVYVSSDFDTRQNGVPAVKTGTSKGSVKRCIEKLRSTTLTVAVLVLCVRFILTLVDLLRIILSGLSALLASSGLSGLTFLLALTGLLTFLLQIFCHEAPS